jgi:hypothetical protein
MMIWPFKLLATPLPPPPEPDQGDHYYNLENAILDLMGWADKELRADAANHHLETVRNHLSDAYVAMWRASQWWHKHHQEVV